MLDTKYLQMEILNSRINNEKMLYSFQKLKYSRKGILGKQRSCE
jgi:hypothetical protein